MTVHPKPSQPAPAALPVEGWRRAKHARRVNAIRADADPFRWRWPPHRGKHERRRARRQSSVGLLQAGMGESVGRKGRDAP